METEWIKRINELSRKQKTAGLTEEEQQEQAKLRRRYVEAYKANLRAQLDNTVIVRPDGSQTHLHKK